MRRGTRGLWSLVKKRWGLEGGLELHFEGLAREGAPLFGHELGCRR